MTVPAPATVIRSAGVVIARRSPGSWRLLVLRAGLHWDFPKGLVEDGESAIDAARREASEGTGISDLSFDAAESHKETIAYGTVEIARYYLAITRTETVTLSVVNELGHPAYDEARWVGFDEAEDYLPPRLAAVLAWVRETLDPD
ncbi:MAG: NUDIX domain-containing protein [Betaproteobacteria bacterium]|nr:NUDIX domain-containing protein [Betaproteobacteria bacterium]